MCDNKNKKSGSSIRNKTMKYEVIFYHPLTGDELCRKQFGRMKDVLDYKYMKHTKGVNCINFWTLLKEDIDVQYSKYGLSIQRLKKVNS